MLRTMFLGSAVFGLIASISCTSERRADASVSLGEQFHRLRPWPAEGDLSAREWGEYLRIAKMLQTAEPYQVENALLSYLAKDTFRNDVESRLFLLLRVAFELPKDAPKEEFHSFKGWHNWSDAEVGDMRVNLNWPIAWRDGRPALVSNCRGSEGLPYAAVDEYRHFLKKYPFRKL